MYVIKSQKQKQKYTCIHSIKNVQNINIYILSAKQISQTIPHKFIFQKKQIALEFNTHKNVNF